MPRPRPGEFPPSLRKAHRVHRLNALMRRVDSWLEADPLPEDREQLARYILTHQPGGDA
ncbi:hypothetical protein [Blastococcus sp. KM273128]|uniref:hypothetical protein n=1 Tax=Blastococcus sp. KM273128 TaxID=2570314 RepID=UPI001F367C11|nr:hypothetical protein [Blastococcus sp. KM273128]